MRTFIYATKQFGGVVTALPSMNLMFDFHCKRLKRILPEKKGHLSEKFHVTGLR